MKYHFAFIFCLSSFSLFAQTSYQDFIQQDNTIQWAAEYNPIMDITPKVKKFRIRQILLQQQARKGCLDSYRINNDSIAKFKFCKGDSFSSDSFISDENIYRQYEWNSGLNDDNPFIINEKKCSCTDNTSSNKIDVYKLKQIIYYKNSKLYTKNIFVTPICLKAIIDSNSIQQFVWQSSFSSCLNNTTNVLTIEQKKRSVDLGNSAQRYNLNYDSHNENPVAAIFTLKNPILSHHLFEDIFANKITAVDDSNNIISPKKIWRYKNPPVEVAFYDSDGNVLPSKMIEREVNIDSFYKYEINQHFYFDTVNNILYSEVNYIEIRKNVINSMGMYLGDNVYIRIYFIKPSLYKKSATHRFLND